MMVPISVGAPCLAPSPSHFKCLTGKIEPLPLASASIPFSCCILGELWAPRELLQLLLAFSEESKQTKKRLSS